MEWFFAPSLRFLEMHYVPMTPMGKIMLTLLVFDSNARVSLPLLANRARRP